MPTKLSQDQVENLNSDLDSLDLKDASLESKISTWSWDNFVGMLFFYKYFNFFF